jgi:Xaa-Pro aminopeptidase
MIHMDAHTSFALYAERRARLAALLGPGGIAIVPTAPERTRNRDSDYLFRFDSYFYYLTGFTEPNAWLVITAEGESTLFCNPKDLEREIWDGYRLGPVAAPGALGVQQAHPTPALDSELPKLLENRRTVWFPFAIHAGLEGRIDGWLQKVRTRVRYGALCPDAQRDLCGLLDEMRLVKDAHEIAIMRRAGQISAQAHIRAMQRSAAMIRAGEDVREYHLDAELLHEFRRHGSQYPAYGSIVAAGANACVLHYRADNAPVRDGDLVLIDAGCEIDGYTADITRTWPIDSEFAASQRAVYQVVLRAQLAAIASIRPGRPSDTPHKVAQRELTKGLLRLGILAGKPAELLKAKAFMPFYMHGTSHWLGLDVHDCGAYQDERGRARPFQAGMVLTVEPGLYFDPAARDVPKEFRGIGIRIEDDILVTPTGSRSLTESCPKTVAELESLRVPTKS